MMPKVVALSIAFALVLACARAVWTQETPGTGGSTMENPIVAEAIDTLDACLVRALQKRNLPGLSAGVVHDQQLIWSKGYGFADIERQLEADPESIYEAGSITKMFNATMLMQLRDAGKLSLDDPIEKYLPNTAMRSRFPDPRPPTFRQVVAHVAGIPMDYGFDVSVPGEWRQFPAATVLSDLENMHYAQPAYARIHYSNLGIYIMGQALQRVAAQPYTDYVESHIFEPLGMTATGWKLTDDMAARLAIGYGPKAEGKPRARAPSFVAGDFGTPAGGVKSSVVDMAKFLSFQFREGQAGGAQILGSTTLREMRAPVFLREDWRGAYGIGWELSRVAGHTVAGHGGGGLGYVAEIKFIPDLKLGFILFINQVTGKAAIAKEALEALIPAFEDYHASQVRVPVGPLPAMAQEYVGTYSGPLGYAMEVDISDGKLRMFPLLPNGRRGSAWTLVPDEDGAFIIEGGPRSYQGEHIYIRRDRESGIMQLMWQRNLFDKSAVGNE